MRNAILVNDLVVTIDNSGCIGEKTQDMVQVPNEITAYFTARTAILEQLCAGAIPVQLVMANFSGDAAWAQYVEGFKRAFTEMGMEIPPLTGSSESNFEALQSAVSLTILGQRTFQRSHENGHYFVVGEPLVGNEVIKNPQKIANLQQLYDGLKEGWIQAIWPTGSKGIGVEIERFIGAGYTCEGNLHTSAGPSCAVLVAIEESHVRKFQMSMTAPVRNIRKKCHIDLKKLL